MDIQRVKHLDYAFKVKQDESNKEIADNLDYFITNETDGGHNWHAPTTAWFWAWDEDIGYDDDEWWFDWEDNY